MGEGADGGVDVGDDEGEALGGGGRGLPGELGGVVDLALAGGELVGDGAGEAGTFELEGGEFRGEFVAVAGELGGGEGDDERGS